MIANAPERVSGRVESVNEKGCKIDGQWWNYSRFAEALVPPERGQVVFLLLDKSGFVRSCTPLDGDPPRVTGGSDVQAERLRLESNSSQPSTRDRTITRLAVLKAAAEYAASKPGSKSADVLKIAASWERWVTRSDDTADDLAEDGHVR